MLNRLDEKQRIGLLDQFDKKNKKQTRLPRSSFQMKQTDRNKLTEKPIIGVCEEAGWMCGYEECVHSGLRIGSFWTELLYFSALYICPPSLSPVSISALEAAAPAAVAVGMYEALLSCLGDE